MSYKLFGQPRMICTAAFSAARSVSWSRPRDLRTRRLSSVVKTDLMAESFKSFGRLPVLHDDFAEVIGGHTRHRRRCPRPGQRRVPRFWRRPSGGADRRHGCARNPRSPRPRPGVADGACFAFQSQQLLGTGISGCRGRGRGGTCGSTRAFDYPSYRAGIPAGPQGDGAGVPSRAGSSFRTQACVSSEIRVSNSTIPSSDTKIRA